MSRTQRALLGSAVTVVLAFTAGTGGATADRHRVADHAARAAVAERIATRAGLQVSPKHTRRPTMRVGGRTYAAPNPYLAQLRSGSQPDWSYWRSKMAAQGRQRMAARATTGHRVPAPLTYAEQEPAGALGENDTLADSEHLADVGVRQAYQAVEVLGRMSVSAVHRRTLRTHEDQGSIPRATHTRIRPAHRGVLVRSRVGDGRHGNRRRGTGDFDFFQVHALKGETLAATTRGSRVDTILAVYAHGGRVVAANDDDEQGSELTSALDYTVPRTGYYYVMVGGFSASGSLPVNPFRPASGRGAGDEGAYRLRITTRQVDRDYYGFELDSGDVLAGSLTGGASVVGVTRLDGRQMVTSPGDLSGIYPASTPLPGGGSSFAYVAEEPGWYAVSAQHGSGAYRLRVETYRPGTERAAVGAAQTIFLDFDGARLNTNIFGGPGVSTLSPLASFLDRWGLTSADEPALVDAVVAGVRENLQRTLTEEGLNPDVRVRFADSLHDPDPWGQPNVSRIVVGGTIAEAGVPTIGISQSIDPGNFDSEESALVLLDSLSRPAGPDYSLNTYLRARSDRIAFVGGALANVVSHEAGHFLGSFHTDNDDSRLDLMDAGGENFGYLYGAGPDQVGGTADDQDVDMSEDTYAPAEGMSGLQDSLNNSAWALRAGTTP